MEDICCLISHVRDAHLYITPPLDCSPSHIHMGKMTLIWLHGGLDQHTTSMIQIYVVLPILLRAIV
ncbi:hypothetical protein ACJX0J_022207, partial [Zea mays]